MTTAGPTAADPLETADPNEAQAEGERPWFPPIGMLQLFCLMMVSSTLYSIPWGYRAARDIRDHGKGRIWHPALVAALLIIPLVNLVAFPYLAAKTERLVRGEKATFILTGVTSVVFVITATSPQFYTGFVMGRDRLLGDIASLPLAILVAIGLTAMLSAAFLPLNHLLNTKKRQLPSPTWRPVRRSGTGLVVFIGLVIWVMVAAASFRSSIVSTVDQEFDRTIPVPAGQEVMGASELYSVTTPSDDWRKRISYHADLELNASLSDAPVAVSALTVYVGEAAGLTLDDAAQFRRQEAQAETTAGRQFNEVREVLPDTAIPVSYITYTFRQDGMRHYNFIATVKHGSIIMEAVGYTNEGEAAELEVTRLVRSFRLNPAGASDE